MKKLPNKVTTEELLKALESTPEDSKEVLEVFDYRNDVPLFLSHYGIEAGENRVGKRAIRSLYIQYSEVPVNGNAFGQAIANFISGDQHNYNINKTRQEITALLHKKNKKRPRYNDTNVASRKHFELFMEETKIRPGNKWVEAYILQAIYKKWCKENRKYVRFKPIMFTVMGKLYLEWKRTTALWSWFKIDESVLDYLTPEDKEKIRHDRRKRLDKEAKEKKSLAKG